MRRGHGKEAAGVWRGQGAANVPPSLSSPPHQPTETLSCQFFFEPGLEPFPY